MMYLSHQTFFISYFEFLPCGLQDLNVSHWTGSVDCVSQKLMAPFPGLSQRQVVIDTWFQGDRPRRVSNEVTLAQRVVMSDASPWSPDELLAPLVKSACLLLWEDSSFLSTLCESSTEERQ